MKKKRLAVLVAAIVAIVMSATVFFGCDGAAKEYTVQYIDDNGAHTITVTDGMPYSLDEVPTRTGYDFMGLYDREVGGTQYISASGSSLAPFSDKKNIILFPQYNPKKYTVILDYQGAAVTGDRQFNVFYGNSLPELPKGLTLEHKEFSGWYTQAACAGVRVADEYGLVPIVSVLNENNFDPNSSVITLYAGFETEKFTVTCYFEAGMDAEEVRVEYDTPVSKIVTKTRVDGNAPIAWSKTPGGEAFNGKIYGDTTLYAVEYAPVINFDTAGGSEVTPVIARAGDPVTLPTPTKELSKFAYWKDLGNNIYNNTHMPSGSITLTAVWHAMLVFDENGGSDVQDVSAAAGEKITLPVPERDGYIFAGWYAADKTQYTSTTMPSAGVALKAGWYKAKSELVTVISSASSKYGRLTSPSLSELCFTFDYSKFFDTPRDVIVKIDWHVDLKTEDSAAQNCYAEFYSVRQLNSAYLMHKETFNNVTKSYRTYEFSTTFTIGDDFYICWYQTRIYSNWEYFDMYLKDFYYTVYYPDTTKLYL